MLHTRTLAVQLAHIILTFVALVYIDESTITFADPLTPIAAPSDSTNPSTGGSSSPTVVIEPQGEFQAAPHGKGNVYAPDVHFFDGRYRMWFGGQGHDGHDRIQLAESLDGQRWQSCGVVLEDPTANHLNDPSVVRCGDTWFMYYTRAESDVLDEIALATSRDGLHWEPRGVVLRPSQAPHWDSLIVGRPSVLLDGDRFCMWYDGRRDLPLDAPAKDAPKSAASTRAVGYAESSDGIHWRRPQPDPVFTNGAGGIHVSRTPTGYAMVYESHAGTLLAISADGLHWQSEGIFVPTTGTDTDRFGHVTPFLFPDPRTRRYVLFVGAARASTWDQNIIAKISLNSDQQAHFAPSLKSTTAPND